MGSSSDVPKDSDYDAEGNKGTTFKSQTSLSSFGVCFDFVGSLARDVIAFVL